LWCEKQAYLGSFTLPSAELIVERYLIISTIAQLPFLLPNLRDLQINNADGIMSRVSGCDSIVVLRFSGQAKRYPEKLMTVTYKAGSTVCGYRVIESLGEGGLSQLYKAVTPDGILVKLKFPAAAIIGDPATYERFLREFTIGQKLTHPAIQRAIAIEESPEGVFLVLDFIEGKSLRDYIIEHAPLLLDEAIVITTHLLEAIGYLHQNGVFHRDLKPENIIIDPDKKIHIVDFGVALLEGARRVTWRLGSNAFGTPDYMSPEQIQGKRGDARSDIYSLGIIFYELLTGGVPFRGDNPLSIMSQHLTANPKSPRKLNPAVPPGVEAIILKAIRRDPGKRYQSAEAMRQDLQHYGELDLSRFALDAERPARGDALTGRNMWVFSAIITACFLAIAALILFIVFVVEHH